MLYQRKSFTVPSVGDRKPSDCDHSKPWVDLKGRCVQCGATVCPYGDPRTLYSIRRAD